jgi:hypothetical protein
VYTHFLRNSRYHFRRKKPLFRQFYNYSGSNTSGWLCFVSCRSRPPFATAKSQPVASGEAHEYGTPPKDIASGEGETSMNPTLAPQLALASTGFPAPWNDQTGDPWAMPDVETVKD